MKNWKLKLFPAIIVALGILIGCKPSADYTFNGKDYSWIENKDKIVAVTGENYIFITKKASTPVHIESGITSGDASNYLSNYVGATKDAVGIKDWRTFFVQFQKKEFFDYITNLTQIAPIDSFRVYFGAYPSTHPRNPNRFTAMLVGVGEDKLEKYIDGIDGLRIIDLGSLCPTMCSGAAADAKSIYYLAGSPTNKIK